MTTRSALRLRTYSGEIGTFPPPPGASITYCGHGVAGGVPAQGFHDFQPLAHAGAQVRGTGDQVTLVKVVGLTRHISNFWTCAFITTGSSLTLRRSTDWLPRGMLGVGQAAQRVAYLGGQFPRVV